MGWLARERTIVRDRQLTLESIHAGGGIAHKGSETARVSSLRRWFGDRPRELILLPEDMFSEQDVENMRPRFPDASIERMSPKRLRYLQEELRDD
jgi:hypothetical protein